MKIYILPPLYYIATKIEAIRGRGGDDLNVSLPWYQEPPVTSCPLITNKAEFRELFTQKFSRMSRIGRDEIV